MITQGKCERVRERKEHHKSLTKNESTFSAQGKDVEKGEISERNEDDKEAIF